MEVTKDRIDTLIQGIKAVAKSNRERAGFAGKFTPIAIVIGPKGQHSVQATPYRDAEEKNLVMKAISITAREMNVVAIVLVNDTMALDIPKFIERYALPPDISQPDFDKIYRHILDSHFEGSIANLPADVLTDALCVVMKSPLFPQFVCMLTYHEGVGDSIRWDEEVLQPDAEILSLEDWWDTDTTTVH